MALFHLHLKQISRRNKQGGSKSAASVVAYRERAKIAEFDYRRKGGFLRSYTLIPEEFQGTELAEILSTPDGFAEITEKTEKRKDSQLWDELEISLQKELSLAENVEILNQLVRETYTVRNQVARVFIHHPPETDNIHAHVLVIQRPLQKATNGGVELGKKIRQEFARGKPKSSEIVDLMRSRWSSLCNDKFAEKNLEISISHETLEKQKEQALLAGDLIKAAELDRPPLFLPKTSRKALCEVIVTDAGDYDFTENKQHLANTIKTKDIENLTIDFWVKAVQFWTNAKKIKTNFKLARRKQRETIRKIIKENINAAIIKYAEASISARTFAISKSISKLRFSVNTNIIGNPNASLRHKQRSNYNRKLIESGVADWVRQSTENKIGSTSFRNGTNGKPPQQTTGSVKSQVPTVAAVSAVNTNTTTTNTRNNSYAASSNTITIEELNQELEKRQQPKYTPRRR